VIRRPDLPACAVLIRPLVRTVWVISCFTALAACSSEPPASRIQPREYAGEDDGAQTRGSAKGTPDDAPVDAGMLDPDAGGDLPPPPPPPADPPPPTPPPPSNPPAPAAVGTACQQGDTAEIKGQLTPFTKSACGDVGTATDEDFYALNVPAARTLTLRIGAEADAVARLETPNGNVIVVSNGATGNVASASGTAIIRVRSKLGKVQDYRIVVE
jgi:hypothetical protein